MPTIIIFPLDQRTLPTNFSTNRKYLKKNKNKIKICIYRLNGEAPTGSTASTFRIVTGVDNVGHCYQDTAGKRQEFAL